MKYYDLSNGSTNPYQVEPRHRLIPLCIHCGEASTIKLDGTDYYRHFIKGEFVQNVFTYLSAGHRELLLSGVHPECWDELFKEEIDEEDSRG